MDNSLLKRISDLLPLPLDYCQNGKWFFVLFLFIFQIFSSQESSKLFVTGDVVIVGLDENIEVVQINSGKDSYLEPKHATQTKKIFLRKVQLKSNWNQLRRLRIKLLKLKITSIYSSRIPTQAKIFYSTWGMEEVFQPLIPIFPLLVSCLFIIKSLIFLSIFIKKKCIRKISLSLLIFLCSIFLGPRLLFKLEQSYLLNDCK